MEENKRKIESKYIVKDIVHRTVAVQG